jgi:hypothetical protein
MLHPMDVYHLIFTHNNATISGGLVQYAGFLATILIVELTLAISLYTYKDHINSGLRQGLNTSLHNYGPGKVRQSADFDAMQENVSGEINN